jgi:hypothetical protein
MHGAQIGRLRAHGPQLAWECVDGFVNAKAECLEKRFSKFLVRDSRASEDPEGRPPSGDPGGSRQPAARLVGPHSRPASHTVSVATSGHGPFRRLPGS